MSAKSLKIIFFIIFCLFMMGANQFAYSANKLKVGVWEIGPFVIKDTNDKWTGLAIEVWEGAAKSAGLDYEYIPLPHHDLFDAV